MDLGIRGRNALVCGASKGLGRACAFSLAREGAKVTIVARGAEALEKAAREIGDATRAQVSAVAADITTPEGRSRALAAAGDIDILLTNAAGPPPGDFREWGREQWMKALEANMLTPIELIKATIDGMIARKFGRIVNITSGAVKAPIPQLGLSNGARTGLTGFAAGLARQVAMHNVTINNLLPGAFATDRLQATMAAAAKSSGKSVEEIREERLRSTPAGRLGEPPEFGDACAYLCSAQAGYITGQNLLIDGGAYPGTL